MSSGVSSAWKSIHVRLIVALDGVKLMLWLLIYTHAVDAYCIVLQRIAHKPCNKWNDFAFPQDLKGK